MALFSRSLVLSVTALALSACSQADPTPTAPLEEKVVGTTTEAITSADVIARAEQWSNAKLLYCQAPNHKADPDVDCPSVCNRQDNPQWDPYRSDCSGLVSWAWGLPPPGRSTDMFAPFDTKVSKQIAPLELAPGDALNSSPHEHIVLFKEWVTKGSKAVFIEEPGCSTTPNYAHEFTASVTIAADGTMHIGSGTKTYIPIRFDSIVQQAPDYAAQYVSQSWPLSSAPPIALTVGVAKTGSIDLKNVGAKTWTPGVVKLAPIPRDQASNLAASTWLSGTRVSTVSADVPPGGVGHFEWDLEAAAPGDFKPYFGLVAEGITWFSDSGGPGDDVIQVNVHVVAAPPGSGGAGGSSAAGGNAGASGATTGKGGSAGTATGGGNAGAGVGGQASAGSGTAGAKAAGGGASGGGPTSGAAGSPSSGGSTANAGAPPAYVVEDSPSSGSSGGCSVGTRTSHGAGGAILLALVAVARRRRRDRVALRRRRGGHAARSLQARGGGLTRADRLSPSLQRGADVVSRRLRRARGVRAPLRARQRAMPRSLRHPAALRRACVFRAISGFACST